MIMSLSASVSVGTHTYRKKASAAVLAGKAKWSNKESGINCVGPGMLI